MSEAMLTALSVCSASAKPIVVFVSFSPFFPLPRGKLSVLPALKGKRKLKEKIYGDRIYFFIFFKRKQQKENNSHLWISLSGEGLRGKVSIQAGENQWLASVWSVWRLPFPPLPLSHSFFVFLTPSLSLPYRRLPPSPPLPPSTRLLLTNTQLISVWRLVVLPAHWSLLPKTERTWDTHVAACQPVCVFWITGVFIQQLCVYVCVCVCLCSCVSESRDRVRSSGDECWMCSKYLLNHTRSSARVCVHETRHIASYKCTHIDSRPLILWFCYAVPKQCMFHCGSVWTSV